MAEELPEDLVLLTRTQIRDRWCRDYQVRQPLADVGPTSMPFLDASTFADQQTPVYNDASVIAKRFKIKGTFGTALDEIRVEYGLPEVPAAGGIGHVDVVTATGGANILTNAELTAPGNLRFKCLVGGVYTTDTPVPVGGITTGPATNLDAGTKLTWTNPAPGLAAACEVTEQSDGSGLTGGRNAETDEEKQNRIIDRLSNPPASGNAAAVIAEIERTSGLAIQKGFYYPAIKGTGTYGIAFTMKPATPGGSRLPNAAHVAQVEANVKAAFPGDDGVFGCTLLAQPVDVVLKVTWTGTAANWTDNTPWPAYASTPVAVDDAIAISASGFRATTSVDTTTPVVGQTIGLYDSATGSFKRKRIATVTTIVANRSWTLTFDMTNNASDPTFIPVDDAIISPWSDSLDDIVGPVLLHMEGRGPGEQVAVLPDPGVRQRRIPESPASWPSTITNRITEPLFSVASVHDVQLVSPTVPHTTTVGTPGVASYLLELGDLAVFKL